MIGDIKKFKFWCQKVLPLVYDNSLSYYEVLCKVSAKLNELINNVNDIPAYIDAKIEEAFDEEHIIELLSQFITKIQSAISSNNEGTNVNSSKDYNVGQMLWLNNTLYRVIRPISAGATFIVDTNIEAVDFETMFNDFVDEVKHDITANDDGTSATATQNWRAGQWLWLNDDLYEVISDITQGNAYVFNGANANVKQITVENKVSYILTSLINEITNRENADTALSNLINAETENRANADIAINNAISELNTDIDNIKYYVTPEEYGAVGDGVTDDTQAFYDAFHSGKPVKCFMGKTYKVGVLDLHDIERIFFDGNRAKIVGAQFHVNVNIGSDQWIQSYAWQSYIDNVYFISESTETALHLGCGLRMRNCVFDDYYTAIDFTHNYLDTTDIVNTSFRNYNRGDNDTPKINHAGLGDQLYIKGCHHTGPAEKRSKYIFSGTYVNCGTMVDNIACGIYVGASSCLDIISCKFPIDGITRIDVDNDSSNVSCHNCEFASVARFNNRVHYYDCTFREHAGIGGVNGLTIEDFENQCEHCLVGVNRNPDSAGLDSWVNSDDCKLNNFDYDNTSGDIFITNSIRTIDSSKAAGVPQTGTYRYYVIPSMYADRLVRHASNALNYYLETSADAGQTIYLRVVKEIILSFKHVYRINPDNTISHAVIPPTRFYNSGSTVILDNGICNGFAWETVSALPTITASNVSMKNGIVSAFDTNLPTGALYIDTVNDNVIKQK